MFRQAERPSGTRLSPIVEKAVDWRPALAKQKGATKHAALTERIIADIDAVPVAVLPQLDEHGQPLDLSMSVLRSVSPIHIEYLKNMGVGASLSISIVVDGKLWGLFACHHYGPRLPSARNSATWPPSP